MSADFDTKDFKQFIQQAIRTESKLDTLEVNQAHLAATLNALISLGNYLDLIKKHTFYGFEFYYVSSERKAQDALVDAQALVSLEARPSIAGSIGTNKEIVESIDPRVFHGIVGVATESIELLELLRGVIVHEKELDTVNLQEEMADILWYFAIILDEIDGDFEGMLVTVINKLRARFPEKFDSAAAITRDLDTEREVLEQGFNNTKEVTEKKPGVFRRLLGKK